MKIVTKKAKGSVDFKKQTVKVGKKLKPQNETKISVKSKTIYIANHGEEKANVSYQSQLEKQLQFLTHHAAKTREVAIENISQMVEKGQVLDTYVPILITAVMDVLQDEEPKVRSAILALFTTLCGVFSHDVFAACSGIIVTYVCSGLTSLNKRIRKDSLHLLKVFCDHHYMEIFDSFHIRLLTLLQKLLTESMVGLSFSSTDCNNVSGNVAKTAISKLSSSHIDRLPTPNAQNRNNHAIAPIRATAVKNLKAEAQVRANKKAPPIVTMFVLLLQVIREIVVCGGRVLSGGARKVEYASANEGSEASFLLLRANVHVGRAPRGVLHSTFLDEEGGKEHTCHLTGLAGSLTLLWEAVVSDEHLLTNDSISCLLELSGVLLAVAQQCEIDRAAFPGVSKELRRLLGEIMCAGEDNDARQFPYGSQVVSVSCAGSPEHSAATVLVDRLNMSVCRLAACMGGELRDPARPVDTVLLQAMQNAQQYEVQMLQAYVAALRDGLVTCGGVVALSHHAVNTLIERHAAIVPAALRDTEEGLTHLLVRQGSGGDSSDRSGDAEMVGASTIQMVTALFDTIQAAVAAVKSNRSTVPEFRNRVHNRSLVRELNQLLRASVQGVCVLAQHVVENQRFHFTVDEVVHGAGGASPYGPVVLDLFGAIVQNLLDTASILFVSGGDGECETVNTPEGSSAALAAVIFKTLIAIVQATRWSLVSFRESQEKSASLSAENLPVAALFKNSSNIINTIFCAGPQPSVLLSHIWGLGGHGSDAGGLRYVVAELWFYSRFLLVTQKPFHDLLNALPSVPADAHALHLCEYVEKLELYSTV